MGSREIDVLLSKTSLLLLLWTGVMLADFHNVGVTRDLNDELNRWAKGMDSSFAQALIEFGPVDYPRQELYLYQVCSKFLVILKI